MGNCEKSQNQKTTDYTDCAEKKGADWHPPHDELPEVEPRPTMPEKNPMHPLLGSVRSVESLVMLLSPSAEVEPDFSSFPLPLWPHCAL